jgi:hypothetical protein
VPRRLLASLAAAMRQKPTPSALRAPALLHGRRLTAGALNLLLILTLELVDECPGYLRQRLSC